MVHFVDTVWLLTVCGVLYGDCVAVKSKWSVLWGLCGCYLYVGRFINTVWLLTVSGVVYGDCVPLNCG